MHCTPQEVLCRGTAQDQWYVKDAAWGPAGRPSPRKDANMAAWLLSLRLGNAYFMTLRVGVLPVRTTASDPCWPASAQGQAWVFTPNYYHLCDLKQQTNKIFFVVSLFLIIAIILDLTMLLIPPASVLHVPPGTTDLRLTFTV